MQTPIELVWEELSHNNERPVFRRVDDEHPLDLYAGIDADDSRMLMLVHHDEPPTPPDYDTISVSRRKRTDGNWTLIVALSNKELTLPFARLCQDLIDHSRNHQQAGPTVLINRLARWRRLMELARRTLSEQALRGLVGELLILKDAIAPRYGNTAAVSAWVGPYDASQDFVLAGIAIEVKTITPTATTVKISSLEQLDANTPIILATVLLSPSSQQQQGAFTPAQLVQAMREEIGEALRAEFDLRLAEAGYEENAEHNNTWYETSGTRYYRVNTDFPRLTTTTVPTGVTAANYDVTLRSCATYELPENEPWT